MIEINSNTKRNTLISIFSLFFLFSGLLHAQIKNNSTLFIGDNATVFIQSGAYTFASGSVTQTSRTSGTNGTLQLSAAATFSGASSSLFVNGFVSTKSNSYFELPTGQGTTYAPIGVTNAAVTNGVAAAYYSGNLASTAANATINALPTAGYWEVKGDAATIHLKWSSDISTLTNSMANLTVAGYHIANGKWEAITSETPTGSLTSGTIATSAAVNLSDYSAFTLAKRAIVCAELVTTSGQTRTWNGTSWDVVPTLADAVQLTGNYPGTAGSFVCNSLNIGTNNITLTNGQTVEVVNGISGTGTITLSSEASILQRNDASSIAPQIILTKSTRTGMYAYDYIYWGSPLTTDSFSQLNNARAYTNDNTTPSGAIGAFGAKYKFVSGDTTTAGGWQNLTATEPGKGFIMNIKNQAPFSSTQNNTDHINLTFTGIANNGTITVSTANVVGNNTSDRNNNLLSNPYPSAIDADKFLEYNTNLDGVIYLWKAQTPNSGAAGEAYAIADYIVYTRAGSTGYSGVGADPFNGNIASGQGFKVQAINSSGSGNVTFNNCMRISGNNDQFVRTTNDRVIDRYKLKLTGANGFGNQILVAYMPETTLEYDRLFDAKLNSVSSAQLYSILEGTNTKLAINARPAFQINDMVSLGLRKATTSLENISISITDKEGVFTDSTLDVYLHDLELDIYHNLENGPYSIFLNATELNDRFQIVYHNNTLSNPNFDTNSVFATLNKQTLSITSNTPILQVGIYDLSGRLVINIPVDQQTSVTEGFPFATGIYVAKIKLNSGVVVTKKIINSN